jgi:hypothetical protein
VSLSWARTLSAASIELMYTKKEFCQHSANAVLTKWCARLEVKKYRANVTADWGAATCTVKVAIADNLMRLLAWSSGDDNYNYEVTIIIVCHIS